MERGMDAMSKALDRKIGSIGADRLTEYMYRYLRHSERSTIFTRIRLTKYTGTSNADTRKSFKDWLDKICEAESEDNFKSLLMSSRDFMVLSYSLCLPDTLWGCSKYGEDTISVRSSDNVIFEMNKSAATTLSTFLKDYVDAFPTVVQLHGIPLNNISSLVLPKIISFCKNKYNRDMLLESSAEHFLCLSKPSESAAEHFFLPCVALCLPWGALDEHCGCL